jgi:hypothetical protein
VTLLEDLVAFIVAAGLAVGDNVDTFRDYSPDDPDDTIVFYEYDAISTSDKGYSVSVRYVQVACRSATVAGAKAKCDALFNLFNRPDENITDLPNGRWSIIVVKNPPLKISLDERDRIIYAFNMAITTNVD